MRREFLIVLLLALITATLYSPVTTHDFVNYDDHLYVTENPQVQGGISGAGIVWAFTNMSAASNWHPITWISHMLDCQLYGLRPGGPHFTNLLLHVANTVLVFLFWRRFTGAVWRSALVAALFGWHPMHVESVAWVAERKDVLSTLFWLLTLWTYASYTQAEVKSPKAKKYYCLSLGLFAMGLMAKSMLVTLPFVLLLLDYWPLRRIAEESARNTKIPAKSEPLSWSRLIWEKVPFFGLTMVFCVITYIAQMRGGTVQSLENESILVRLGHGLIAYLLYLGKMFWPSNLAVFYPFWAPPVWLVVLAILMLAGLTLLMMTTFRPQRYALVGWLWFLGTLVPVLGLVQVGSQSIADRYTYVPYIGLFLILAWAAGDLSFSMPRLKIAISLGWIAVLLALASVTTRQLRVWKNSESLFRHAIAVTDNNYLAYINLSGFLEKQGRIDEAILVLKEGLHVNPNGQKTLAELFGTDENGNARFPAGYVEAQLGLGALLGGQGKFDEALAHVQLAADLRPHWPPTVKNFGRILFSKGDLAGAFAQYSEAAQLNPKDAEVQGRLAAILVRQHQFAAALGHYREALQLDPDSPAALNDLAWLLATSEDATLRNGTEAVQLAERACEKSHYQIAMAVGTLAAAYAEAGRFKEAVDTAQKAYQLAQSSGQTNVAKKNQELLELYRNGRAYHEISQ